MDPYGFIREYQIGSDQQMPILTSYYYHVQNFPNNIRLDGNITGCPFCPFSINLFQKDWIQVTEYKKLIPTEECTKNLTEWGEEYNTRYRELVLNKLNPFEIYEELVNWASIDGIKQIPVLIGHETYKDLNTERYTVSRWFRQNGISSGELIYPIKIDKGIIRYIEY